MEVKRLLSKLGQSHIKNGNPTPCLDELLSPYPPEVKTLVKETGGKQALPYEYITSWDRLNSTTIPPIEAFSNKLSNSHLSPQNYKVVKKLFDLANCKSLLDYSSLYLRADVGLLADVFLKQIFA